MCERGHRKTFIVCACVYVCVSGWRKGDRKRESLASKEAERNREVVDRLVFTDQLSKGAI